MSDSEEDFESADENFDIEPQKEKPIKKETTSNLQKIEKKTTASNTTKTTTTTTSQKNDAISEEIPVDGWDIDDWGEEDVAAAKVSGEPKIKIDSQLDTFPVVQELSKIKIKDPAPEEVIKNVPVEAEYNVKNALDKIEPTKSWGGWGMSFLMTASKNVANVTTQVSQGISKTIESGLGTLSPDFLSPEEMARSVVHEEKSIKANSSSGGVTTPENSNSEAFNLDHLLSGVSSMSSKVINSSLDTLEGIGKKTMSIIQENDPGLLNRRKLLMNNDKPVLSQILREAKEKTEESERNMKQIQKKSYQKQVHFETLFDDYCGIVHLEALEMLSKQASIKLQTLLTPLSGKALEEMEQTLTEVNELCELPEMDDDPQNHSLEELEERLKAITEELTVTLEFDDIIGSWKKYADWLTTEASAADARKVYEKSMHCLAEMTALSVAKIHKLAEKYLILELHSTANEVDSLVELTVCFCWHLSGVSSKFGEALSNFNMDEDNNTFITSIFLEATNSNKYIQNAFGLVIPIIQLGAA